MSKYITKQRKNLIDFLSAHSDESFSAKQISLELSEDNISISAVYRNLSELEAEGKVRRVSQGNGREIYYQYTDSDCCKGCLHLICNKCKKTYHMNTKDADILIYTLAQNQHFQIDRKSTVLYGICAACHI
ncbi:MAG: transcriptional repressor [Lachnospiraceae bacterium]|nr:transcriptional repressor [Lachnospiraceae bacterium]